MTLDRHSIEKLPRAHELCLGTQRPVAADAEIRQAEQAQPPDEPHHPVVVGLAHWLPQVGQACENPETDEAELDQLLSEAIDGLEGLREITLIGVAA